jgi:hypothetical protein
MMSEPKYVLKSWAKNFVPASPRCAFGLHLQEKTQAMNDFETSLWTMKEILQNALHRNTGTHTMIVLVNHIMVGIGIGFVILSIVYNVRNTIVNEMTLSSTGLPVADFAALFLVNPQERISGL